MVDFEKIKEEVETIKDSVEIPVKRIREIIKDIDDETILDFIFGYIYDQLDSELYHQLLRAFYGYREGGEE